MINGDMVYLVAVTRYDCDCCRFIRTCHTKMASTLTQFDVTHPPLNDSYVSGVLPSSDNVVQASSSATVVRFSCYCILAVINFAGNSLNLAAIRLTPRLQTKANYALTGLMMSDILIGFVLLEYVTVCAVVAFHGGPCTYNLLVAFNCMAGPEEPELEQFCQPYCGRNRSLCCHNSSACLPGTHNVQNDQRYDSCGLADSVSDRIHLLVMGDQIGQTGVSDRSDQVPRPGHYCVFSRGGGSVVYLRSHSA